jgi:hypothetical protein
MKSINRVDMRDLFDRTWNAAPFYPETRDTNVIIIPRLQQ